ncbi:MAG: hypothetical protein KGL39_09070 [Patescibacteria group bacterium]|nr:hypothetical protein [Patescibacteria group bacterium]
MDSSNRPARMMTPLGKTVVLNMIAPVAQVGRVLLPDGARVNYAAAREAYVVDVGPEVVRPIAVGDRVLVAPLVDGVDIDVPGTRTDGDAARERYRIVGEKAVLAVISERRPAIAIAAELVRLHQQWKEALAAGKPAAPEEGP